ncbi:MAG: hypothetical protein U0Q15_01865 [Kineosporiaceae bacterium]
MRLQRGTLVAGMAPELARSVARAVAGDYRETEVVAWRARMTEREVVPLLEALAADGFLLRVDSAKGDPENDELPEGGPWPLWRTTVTGGALTMASFLKPITRAKVDSLLTGVLDRAIAYNEDTGRPLVITEIRVFGSYLTDAPLLGDLDLAMSFADRSPDADRAKVFLAYADASGRSFSTFVERLCWPEKELLQILRNRSGYINVHTEDISRFTDRWETIYPRPASVEVTSECTRDDAATSS